MGWMEYVHGDVAGLMGYGVKVGRYFESMDVGIPTMPCISSRTSLSGLISNY